MGLLGHCAVGLAAKPVACKVPLGILLLAPLILDILAITFAFAGIESGNTGNPWSHGLFMSLIWSLAAALVCARIYGDYRTGAVIGLVVFSHWVLDLVSHPIPFSSFSWRNWQWDFGHPMPPDLPLLFGGSPRVGLGLYNHISAVEATVLELGMFAAGVAVYVLFMRKRKQEAV